MATPESSIGSRSMAWLVLNSSGLEQPNGRAGRRLRVQRPVLHMKVQQQQPGRFGDRQRVWSCDEMYWVDTYICGGWPNFGGLVGIRRIYWPELSESVQRRMLAFGLARARADVGWLVAGSRWGGLARCRLALGWAGSLQARAGVGWLVAGSRKGGLARCRLALARFWARSRWGGLGRIWAGSNLGWVDAGLDQSWAGSTLGWVNFGLDQFWAGSILGWINSGLDQFWAGSILGWVNFGLDQSWAGSVLGWINSGRDQFWAGSSSGWLIVRAGFQARLTGLICTLMSFFIPSSAASRQTVTRLRS
ncbi:hypothetical protein BJ508DRAFT_376316 [Ascobolus immersus RN42]|uniref:Uncharacterized protein n=1 Tax=Ascobolus immersus RN42 TaxID=1160509 RepID=A0A3N4I666_ASCIM|nr:hypothetical protein BJ508DRAFT_376316 [Ascobolus immersus RN42]